MRGRCVRTFPFGITAKVLFRASRRVTSALHRTGTIASQESMAAASPVSSSPGVAQEEWLVPSRAIAGEEPASPNSAVALRVEGVVLYVFSNSELERIFSISNFF